jgi:putative tryptophan/tyrosine transport system substrate-binding protein
MEQVVSLAARYGIPAIHSLREYAAAGGLMSYGTKHSRCLLSEWHIRRPYPERRQVSDLPVLQSAKFEFVINLKAAKALSLEITPNLLALADEVIE